MVLNVVVDRKMMGGVRGGCWRKRICGEENFTALGLLAIVAGDLSKFTFVLKVKGRYFSARARDLL